MTAGTYPAEGEMCICVTLCDCPAFACWAWRIQRNLKDILCFVRDLNWEPSECECAASSPHQTAALRLPPPQPPNGIHWI